ncbi:MAG: Fe2+-dependent dioxygenase [Thiobacillaceae bacterium]|nr:Fe2+-dependent dioxygenase [Thiobacillaceae bacterium]MCX7673190.1 Fe2+-dependent dioxygenase [Thiobacillaceae bacterium]MDW8322853.1 Fe2+-dependent dioxygenase [Burkholderiales bacterium]
MLLTISDVIDAAELARLRSLAAQARWESGLATAGPQAAVVKNNRQIAEDSPELEQMRRIVLNALYRNPLVMSAALPARILPPFFNRYGGRENAYGAHVDNAIRATAEGYVRADVSATLFLSDPADYDGGELVIHDTYAHHAVKLPAGSLVLYPCALVHEVTPVTRGERIACFMFMQSLVREAERRRLLFDMDMALIDLRARLGEADGSVLRLTGVYHNLLRLWACPT